MSQYRLIVLLSVCCLFTINFSAEAQSSSPKPPPSTSSSRAADKSQSEDDAVRLKREARLAFAVQIVSALADEARNYKDESLRVKIQARAADVLWDVEQARARTLFDRAWDAAQDADTEGRRQNEEARKRFLSGQGGTGFIPPAPNLRAEVLRLASLHDRALAERFLTKMDEENKRDEEERKTAKTWDPTEPSEAIAKRLQLARQLLETGENEKALAVAAPGLSRVTSPGIIFLVLLRQTNSAMADQLFFSMLEAAIGDPTADATSVSLLSSYVFTPSVLVTSTRNGLLMNPWTAPLPPPNLAPALRGKFFSTASQILLRPLLPAELELTSAGLAGTYFTIQRLLPLFQQSVPEIAGMLQSKLDALAEGREEVMPQRQRDFINAGFNAKETKEETSEDLLVRIERASSTRERNHLYAIAARNATMKNDPKARELADKIEDADLRKRVRNFVDFILIAKALEKKESEKVLQLLRAAELTHLQRAWSYTEIASVLKPSASDRANDLIIEAVNEAGRIDATSVENAEAWVAIGSRAGEIDRAREWEAALDAVKATNKTESYTGEENSLSVDFHSEDSITQFSVAAPSISIARLFATLAKEDANQAANIATTIKSEAPRAVALLACARSIFDTMPKKKKEQPPKG